MTNHDPKQLAAAGYRRISRKFGMLARVDRVDWLTFLSKELTFTAKDAAAWFEREQHNRGSWADYYRRVHSKDKIEIPVAIALKVPASCHDPIGFIDA